MGYVEIVYCNTLKYVMALELEPKVKGDILPW